MKTTVSKLSQYVSNNHKKVQLIALAFAIVIGGIFTLVLPNKVPMQWASDGRVTYYLPKQIAILVLPLLVSLFNFLGSVKRKEWFYFILACFYIILQSALFIFIMLHY